MRIIVNGKISFSYSYSLSMLTLSNVSRSYSSPFAYVRLKQSELKVCQVLALICFQEFSFRSQFLPTCKIR